MSCPGLSMGAYGFDDERFPLGVPAEDAAEKDLAASPWGAKADSTVTRRGHWRPAGWTQTSREQHLAEQFVDYAFRDRR